jgi:hypothetical protein
MEMSQETPCIAILNQQKWLFFNGEQESKQDLSGGLVLVGSTEDIRKGVGGWICWNYYVLVYENGKMRPVDTIPGTGDRDDKGEWRRSEFD